MQVLSPEALLVIIGLHFLLLILIAWFTSRGADNDSFFVANRKSSWVLVAYGMIGTSISGVTFMSVPGAVGAGKANQAFSYLQFVAGNLVGYWIVALVLLPIYYRLNVITIYEYLRVRLGFWSYRTGAGFFLLSRLVGASFRLYLMALVLQEFVLKDFEFPFWFTAMVVPALIWIYTFKGGTKTIIITDAIQTTFFILALILTLVTIAKLMGLSVVGLVDRVWESEYSRIFFFDNAWSDPNYFFKQFLGGIVTTLAMFGMDQDLMQKNLTCKSIRDAQKNMFVFSLIFLGVVVLFVVLGAALYLFAADKGISLPEKPDQLYGLLAFNYLGVTIGVAFMMGLVASSYASGDSALASLTTSFCIDFLGFEKQQLKANAEQDIEAERKLRRTRILVHLGFTALLSVCILVFGSINSASVVNKIFVIAGYTYGPLLGLFSFGLLTHRNVRDRWVPWICIIAALITMVMDQNAASWFQEFSFGFLTLPLNGLLTFMGLLAISQSHSAGRGGQENAGD